MMTRSGAVGMRVLVLIFMLVGLLACHASPVDAQATSTTVTVAGMDLCAIPDGVFTMGSSVEEAGRDADEGQHSVKVSAFLLGRNEVTVGQFRQYIEETKNHTMTESVGALILANGKWTRRRDGLWNNPCYAITDQHPVTCVTWFDAIEYCNWLSQKAGLQPVYEIDKKAIDPGNRFPVKVPRWLVKMRREANGFRLPTEAEWEYAARAGGKAAFGTLAVLGPTDACYELQPGGDGTAGASTQGPKPCGSFPANAWGLSDMAGNVWEWCWDWYDNYVTTATTDPLGAQAGMGRVLRGGSWNGAVRFCRSANRMDFNPAHASNTIGFRVALNHQP